MNSGKKFEALIKESCKLQGIDFTRLQDAGWRGEKTERKFTIKNICDFILFDGVVLFFAEAKSRKKSLKFSELTQQDRLQKKSMDSGYPNMTCGYLIEFSSTGSLWFLSCVIMEQLKKDTGKKSFNEKDLDLFKKEHPLFCKSLMYWTPKGGRKPRIDMRWFMGTL